MITLLGRAVEFNTAIIYGEVNEELLGRAFEPIRNQIVIATELRSTGQIVEDDSPDLIEIEESHL